MKKVVLYGMVFCMTVCICVGLLVFAAFAPQSRIDQNLFATVDRLSYEGSFPIVGDHAMSALYDNFSEAWILMESKGMVNDSLSTIFTNPLYMDGEEDPVTALNNYVYMVKPVPSSYYTRYWMGFRAIVRWLLVFLDYFQIRRYLSIVFFLLLFSVMGSLTKNLGQKYSMAFALAVLMVRPQVICYSLQFSCCFLIAFSAMLLVPLLRQKEQLYGLFFMELGMLTMYFDFYTVPLITYGLPMVYLCLLRVQEQECVSVKMILKNLSLWVMGYIGMWLSKLALTELLTDQSAVQNAWASVSGRFGLSGERAENGEMYSMWKALTSIWETILPDGIAVCVFWVILLALMILVVWKWKRKTLNIPQAKCGAGILVLAVMPLLWFCITAQPTIMHAFFQYRGIVLLFWGVNAYLCLLFDTKKSPALIKM